MFAPGQECARQSGRAVIRGLTRMCSGDRILRAGQSETNPEQVRMERTYALIVTLVIAAIGLVGVRLMTGGSIEDQGMPLARAGGDRVSGGAGAGDEPAPVGGSRLREGGPAGPSGSDATFRPGADRGPTGGSRAAQTALAGRSGRAASAGIPRRGGAGQAGGAGVSVSPLIGGASRRLEPNEARRADVVEYLASRPAAGRHGESEESTDGIALEVSRLEDTEPAVVRKGINDDSDDEGLIFTKDTVLAFPEGGSASLETGRIKGSITPNWSGTDEGNNSIFTWRAPHEWSNRIELVRNGRYLRFILADNLGREADISVPIDSWIPGESHDFEATWEDQKIRLYIDGVIAGENTYHEFRPPSANMYVGSDHPGSSYSGFDGTLKIKVTGGNKSG